MLLMLGAGIWMSVAFSRTGEIQIAGTIREISAMRRVRVKSSTDSNSIVTLCHVTLWRHHK